jgi:VWFA-related protein
MSRIAASTLLGFVVTSALLLAQEAGTSSPGESEAPREDSMAVEVDPAPDGGPYFESVNVNVVNVDVYVTDKKGEPVTGLTRDDFVVLEDKRAVPISNFYSVEGGRPVAGALPQAEPDPRLPLSQRGLPRIPEEQRLSLVVYIDNFNIRPFDRNRVFRRLREFLHDLDPNDRVMLVSYDRSLHTRQPFTTDATLVANALTDLEKLSGWAVHSDSEWRDLLRDVVEAQNLGEVSWRVKQYAQSRTNDLAFTIDALRQLIDTLAGLPGRKALLYVCSGLSMSPAEELYQAMMTKFDTTAIMSEAREFHLGRRFINLASQANSGRVAFYTIDAGGLRVGSSAQADAATIGATSPGLGPLVDSIYIRNLQAPLQLLAEETGGRAIINTNDVGSDLQKISQGFENYYSLGYSPGHSGDGRYHRIAVELKEKHRGVDLRYRTGYRDKSLQIRMADSTTASLVHNLANNPLEVEFQVGRQVEAEKRNQFEVPVLVRIPLDKVTLVPYEDYYVGRLKLFFGAMDEEGDMSDVSEVPLHIRIANADVEKARTQSYAYSAKLQMRGGGHRLAVGVRDEIAAVESFVTRSFQVGG